MINLTTPTSRIRALFLDIDGTILGNNDLVSPGVRAAIAAARESGCEVVLCTGRSRFTAEPIVKQLGRPYGYLISSNGGVLMHLETGEVIYRRLLPIPVALQIVRILVAADAPPYVYEDATGEGVECARVLHHPAMPVGPFAARPRYRPHNTLLDELPFAPVSVNTFGPAEKIRPLAQQLRAQLPEGVSVILSGTEREWGIEIFVAGVSKRIGLEAVAARLTISREEVMAIGDHFNDLEMLEWAGLGIAMGNAQPELFSVADWVTGSLAEDGVARAIERFILSSPDPI